MNLIDILNERLLNKKIRFIPLYKENAVTCTVRDIKIDSDYDYYAIYLYFDIDDSEFNLNIADSSTTFEILD